MAVWLSFFKHVTHLYLSWCSSCAIINTLKNANCSSTQVILLMTLPYIVRRWVCTSGLPADLNTTDNIALETMEELSKNGKTLLHKYSFT